MSSTEQMQNMDKAGMKKQSKEVLVNYIDLLRGKIEELVSYKLIEERVKTLERSQIRSLQYNRRESIEIAGIPETVDEKNLEKTYVLILEEIGCGKIEPWQVHAFHRLRNKKNTIIRFVN